MTAMQKPPGTFPYSTEFVEWLREKDPEKFKYFKARNVILRDQAEKEGLHPPKKWAWWNAAIECGYSAEWKPPVAELLEIAEKQRKEREAKKAAEANERAEKEIQRQLRDLQAKEVDLPAELAFALNHLHLIPDATKPLTYKVTPEQAPSLAAWNVLVMAAGAKTKFLEIVTKELLAARAQERKGVNGAGGSETDADLDEVRALLREATAGA